jgi:succinoglycan biosynthesis transport protein ExoP
MPEYLEEETIDLRELGQAIWRRKWIVIAMFLAAVVGAAIASQFMTPIYEAATTVMVQDSGGGGQLAFLDGMGAVVGKNKNQNYVEILKSRTVAMRTAQALGFDYDVHSSEFADFRKNITVQLVQGTDAIKIKVQHPDPEQAQLTANTLVDTFMNLNQEVNTEDARSAREFIGEQLTIVEADLRKAEEELRRFKEQEKVVAPSEEARAVLSRLSSLETSKAEAQVALDELQHKLAELRKKLRAESPTTIASTTIANNPMIMQYQTRLFELETQLSTAELQYTADHPKVVATRMELEQVRARMAKEVERIVSTETMAVNPNYQSMVQQIMTLEVEQVALQAKQQAVGKLITEVERSLTGLPNKEVQLSRLIRNQSVLEQMYLLLKNKYEEYRITEAVKAAGVTIIDRAITPRAPVKPKKKLNVAIAGFLGLFVGLGLVFVMEFLDTTLKSAEDVERLLGLPVLGRIPEVDPKRVRPRRSRGMSTAPPV